MTYVNEIENKEIINSCDAITSYLSFTFAKR